MKRPLLSLLHLCDSLFPTGGFAYSEGLESATASGAITDASAVGEWIEVCLDEVIVRLEGPTVLSAWAAFSRSAWERLVELDREAVALRPSSTARRSTRAMGLRLLRTWQALYPNPSVSEVLARTREGALGPTLPVAFAVACASADVDRRSTVEGFAYNRLAAAISAAMRLMSLGQTDAHRVLVGALARVPPVVDELIVGERVPESFAPALDIATMTQQYVRTRLFRS